VFGHLNQYTVVSGNIRHRKGPEKSCRICRPKVGYSGFQCMMEIGDHSKDTLNTLSVMSDTIVF